MSPEEFYSLSLEEQEELLYQRTMEHIMRSGGDPDMRYIIGPEDKVYPSWNEWLGCQSQ